MTQENGTPTPRHDMSPKKFDVVATRNLVITMHTLEQLRVGEFPFFLKQDVERGDRVFVFIAPSSAGNYVALSSGYGYLLIDGFGNDTSGSEDKKKLALKDAMAAIITQKESVVRKDSALFVRPEPWEHRLYLTVPIIGQDRIFIFKIKERQANIGDVQSAIENSRKRARELHDVKHQPEKQNLSKSEQLLDFVRQLSDGR